MQPEAQPVRALPAEPRAAPSVAPRSPNLRTLHRLAAVCRSSVETWWRHTARKRYWRIFLLGLLALLAADLLLKLDLNRNAVPLVILLASALVPVTFVLYCAETGAFAAMPPTIIGLTIISGAVGGLLVAGFLVDVLLVSVPILGVLTVAVLEEGIKAGAVIWFLRDKRLRSELDGLVLGAVAGMGFATLETAGYGFNAFLSGYAASLIHSASAATAPVLDKAMAAGISTMTGVLLIHMALAVFGHGAWTAIVGAAVWRERGPSVLRITSGVLLALGIAVALHATWDSVAAHPPFTLLLLPVSAFASLWILRFFIREAVARARLGSLSPPPEPLVDALIFYLRHPLSPPVVIPPRTSAPGSTPQAAENATTVLAQAPIARDEPSAGGAD